MYIAGIAAFALIFIYDLNNWKWQKPVFKVLFPVGLFLIIGVSVMYCLPFSEVNFSSVPVRVLGGIIAILSLWAEIYSLFFSFDARDAYVADQDKGNMKVYSKRMYALCRHPGVLFFITLYAGLVLATGMDIAGAALLCALNVLLIVFEDMVVFPSVFMDYGEYKQRTPFLVPTAASIRACYCDMTGNRGQRG